MKRENEAYYTDLEIVEKISKFLPEIKKQKLRILEPSVGSGQLLKGVLKKYKNNDIVIDALDIDAKVLKETKKNFNNFSLNHVKVNYIHDDFLAHNFRRKYDFLICNPPFSLAREFVEKSLTLADNVCIILPKIFLSSEKFCRTREFLENYKIEKIIDLKEDGFEDVKIETICVFINTLEKPAKKFDWMIYRDEKFDKIFEKMELGIFKVFRDRDLKNEIMSSEKTDEKNIWVLRSKNVTKDGLKHIDGYDRFVSKRDLVGSKAIKFLNRDDVFLVPNLTKEIRIYKKPKNVVCNGSVAVLVLNDGVKITDDDLKYFSSDEFKYFYDIATNKSTRTRNLDKNSIFFFGKRKL